MTALHIAALQGQNEMVEILCENKASLNTQEGTFGRTPLHLAVEKETLQNIVCANSLLEMVHKSTY